MGEEIREAVPESDYDGFIDQPNYDTLPEEERLDRIYEFVERREAVIGNELWAVLDGIYEEYQVGIGLVLSDVHDYLTAEMRVINRKGKKLDNELTSLLAMIDDNEQLAMIDGVANADDLARALVPDRGGDPVEPPIFPPRPGGDDPKPPIDPPIDDPGPPLPPVGNPTGNTASCLSNYVGPLWCGGIPGTPGNPYQADGPSPFGLFGYKGMAVSGVVHMINDACSGTLTTTWQGSYMQLFHNPYTMKWSNMDNDDPYRSGGNLRNLIITQEVQRGNTIELSTLDPDYIQTYRSKLELRNSAYDLSQHSGGYNGWLNSQTPDYWQGKDGVVADMTSDFDTSYITGGID